MLRIVGLLSLSMMVPVPWLWLMLALFGLLRLMVKFSLPSARLSLLMATVMVLLVSPGAKLRLPLTAV